MPENKREESGPANQLPQACFVSTHWSVVLAARDQTSPQAAEALEKLCRTYWPPVYAYLLRHGHSRQEAEDLTQEFFARVLQKNYFANLEREGGKFRSFLLTALKHFLANQWDRAQTQKRGGGQKLISLDADGRLKAGVPLNQRTVRPPRLSSNANVAAKDGCL